MIRLFDLLGVNDQDTLLFTSSGAEAVNHVLFSCFLEISRKTGKCHFITSCIEDAPTLQMAKRLEELGCFVKIVPVNDRGEIDVDGLKKLISEKTALISLTVAQGLTGVIQPIEEIAKEKGVLLHLEATHAIGLIHFNLADYVTFGGPIPGTGALFAKKDAPLTSFILGSNSLRAGSINSTLLEQFVSCLEKNFEALDTRTLEMPRLRSFFEKELLNAIPDAKILFQSSLRLPNSCVVSFPFAHQEMLFSLLKKRNVHSLIGGNSMQHLGALLKSSNIDPLDATCSLSFSIDPETTQEDLKKAVLEIKDCVEILRKMAPQKMVEYPFTTYLANDLNHLEKKALSFRFTGSFSEKENRMRHVIGKEKGLVLSLLVDETDGEIADAKFLCFGPFALFCLGEVICEHLIRKDVSRASRISSDLLEKLLKVKDLKGLDPLINQALMAIDAALEKCKDIVPIDPVYETTPIDFDSKESEGVSNWEELTLKERLKLIEEVIEKEIRPYIELDAGGIKIIELKSNHEILISYEGACTTCPSATGSTLGAIQQILHSRISPLLTVIPQF